MQSKLYQVRSTGTPEILVRVQLFFGVQQGNEKRAKCLQERDRFLYPNDDMVSQLYIDLRLTGN